MQRMRLVVALVVAAVSGPHPVSAVWAVLAPGLCAMRVPTGCIVASAVLVYWVHGAIVERTAGRSLQKEYTLSVRQVVPRAMCNLASTAVLVPAPLPHFAVTDAQALGYLLLAIAGNEVVYAIVHRLLHTKWLYPWHALHHTQVAPRAAGAVYCSMVEMWAANVSSVVLPLYVAGAPSGVFFVWIISAVQGTLVHHSGKVWAWNYTNQPRTHDAHHRVQTRHYGNLGLLEALLR